MPREEITDINEYRLRRRRAGSARWVLILVFLVVCLAAGYFFARSSFFAVQEIQVLGVTQADTERIVDLSGFRVGENIFSVTKSNAASFVRAEPAVKSASVKRRLPHTVIITVEERLPVAVLSVGKALVEIDDQGRVLRRYNLVDQAELPLISGARPEPGGAMPGGYVVGQGVAEALTILRALPAEAEDIGEINVSNPQYIKLYTVSGAEIRLGDSSGFAEKYLVYSSILMDNAQNSGRVIAYIDVSTSTPAINYR